MPFETGSTYSGNGHELATDAELIFAAMEVQPNPPMSIALTPDKSKVIVTFDVEWMNNYVLSRVSGDSYITPTLSSDGQSLQLVANTDNFIDLVLSRIKQGQYIEAVFNSSNHTIAISVDKNTLATDILNMLRAGTNITLVWDTSGPTPLLTVNSIFDTMTLADLMSNLTTYTFTALDSGGQQYAYAQIELNVYTRVAIFNKLIPTPIGVVESTTWSMSENQRWDGPNIPSFFAPRTEVCVPCYLDLSMNPTPRYLPIWLHIQPDGTTEFRSQYSLPSEASSCQMGRMQFGSASWRVNRVVG
jgi:hypothetical protein